MKYLMSNFSRVDVAFTRGKGAKLWDSNGEKYIDFAAGIGVCSLGHASPVVIEAINTQSAMIIHSSNIYRVLPQEVLAKKISNLLGYQTYAVFCNSGAEANEAAIKMARKYGTTKFESKKYEILTLKNSFHGRTMATLSATGQDKFHPEIFAPYIEGFKFYDGIDEIIANISDKTVAVMIELIQGEGGICPLDKKSVQKLAKILKEKNLLLITDEVQCGVYRSGEFVASKIYGIEPDIITFAKGLAGGVPIGACVARENIFAPGEHGSTFGGNHLATSTANAVLRELEYLYESGELKKTIAEFEENLDKILKDFPNFFESRTGLGLMQGLVLKDSTYLSILFAECLRNGLLVLKSGSKTLRFLPPLNIKKKEIKAGFEILRKTLEELQD
ncbi:MULTISPECIES: aspartate aminotransferase family protein [unclassified Campylobacter]|uniref:aspartate aminotransferase family protein n=1 Tax=unclassified Campylobacter TaxID=2593542 RepID=UPI0022EA0740|nr:MULTISPECIES: aspartate aminotransferase family protein [unclassified Campylobacter]MDA3047210.1 aspartate aminotransferase family protein [Campylobacter sp. JMF_08 NE1]MDA3053889.1 aspartate aminotransferase family protein [Campylobacter sp. VBCF_07 NA4]MDA3060222.1 aspartate aminotransferase family protein [Campylobacter sp. VBCF_02 NA5]MDA3069738.1 aspartate aminotransferase family protein [Campylobacter sp. VBCF_08 NA3]WBR54932.1 aspartate aminotransferase family protein [Campylobacter 